MTYAELQVKYIGASKRLVEKIKLLRSAEADLFVMDQQLIKLKKDGEDDEVIQALTRSRQKIQDRVSLYNSELNDIRKERAEMLVRMRGF